MKKKCRRPPLSIVIALPAINEESTSASFAGDDAGDQFDVKTRGDVEKILAEMPNEENIIEMQNYIEKLKACINLYMKLTEKSEADVEKLRRLVELEQMRRCDTEARAKCKIENLRSSIKKLQQDAVLMEETLKNLKNSTATATAAKKAKITVKVTSVFGTDSDDES